LRTLRSLGRATIFKVTLVFVLSLIGTFSIMGDYVFWSTSGFMDRQTNTVIETDIEGLAEGYQGL